MKIGPEAFAVAARMLQGDYVHNEGAAALLGWLDIAPKEPLSRDRQGDASLMAAASSFKAFFHITSQTAPGLVALGAVVDPDQISAFSGVPAISVSGVGLTPLDAFRGCVGEGLEAICGVETDADVALQQAEPGPLPDFIKHWLQSIFPGSDLLRNGTWQPLRRLRDGSVAHLPSDLLLRRVARRRVVQPPWPLSVGCGAGQTADEACLHALFELVERDAVALWWRGGRLPKRILPKSAADIFAADLLLKLRQNNPRGRQSFLLDITSDLNVPTVAATSFNADGKGFCCGTSTRATLKDAARSALLEMCQMEVAYDVVQMKKHSRGPAALNEVDDMHLQRYSGIDLRKCGLLQPGFEATHFCDIVDDGHSSVFRQAYDRLLKAGFDPMIFDLSRPQLGIAVYRVVCPGLEVEPSAFEGPRLTAAIAETGGSLPHTGGIALM